LAILQTQRLQNFNFLKLPSIYPIKFELRKDSQLFHTTRNCHSPHT